MGGSLNTSAAVNMKLHSEGYQWLVIDGHKVQFEGTGTMNGIEEDYGFMVTVTDGQANEGGGIDMFRIEIYR